MDRITAGEQWKMDLLTGALRATDATDLLLDNRLAMNNDEMLEILRPMAELRASQIEQGLESAEESTRLEAQRMLARYEREPAQIETIQDAYASAEKMQNASQLTREVAANWLGKLLSNDLVGEMEKELDRTVKTYKLQQQDNQIHLSHAMVR